MTMCLLGLAVPAAGARDCEDLYFGYTAAPDRPAAYACFDEIRRRRPAVGDGLLPYAFLVLMRIDGDGVDADPNEAAALLEQWREVDRARSEQRLFLGRVLLERRAGLQLDAPAPIAFCDMPGDRAFGRRCEEIERRRREGVRERRLEAVRSKLPEAVRARLSGLLFTLEGYAEREAARVEHARVLDDDGEEAARSRRRRIQRDFDEAVERIFVDRALDESASPLEASRRERELERVYEEDLREQAAMFAAYERSLPDSAARYARLRRRYDDAAAQAHASWKRYRDAWVEAVGEGAENGGAGARASSVRLLLASQRMLDLRPSGPPLR